jgi:hypothetical protein
MHGQAPFRKREAFPELPGALRTEAIPRFLGPIFKHIQALRAMNEQTRIELEAAAFRRLLQHLRDHSDVQNIDLMILAGFCRNCLAKWYSAEAKERGIDIDYPAAQEIIYGMPYAEWKAKYQKEATPEQLKAMEEIQRRNEAAGH